MKKSAFWKIALSVFLIVLCALLVVSCGKEEKDNKKNVGGDYLDDLPEELDYNGEVINVFHWGNEFVTNELMADGSTGDIVDVAIYNRNLSVEERLNVDMNYIIRS